MERDNKHWTEKEISDFIFRIGADFVAQIENELETGPFQQKDLAKKLDLSEGAVSQTLNNPGNLKLKTIVRYARALGMKASIILYDDNDPQNEYGPIHADVFKSCWENAGKPKNFWDTREIDSTVTAFTSDDAMVREESNGGWVFFRESDINMLDIYRPEEGHILATVSNIGYGDPIESSMSRSVFKKGGEGHVLTTVLIGQPS